MRSKILVLIITTALIILALIFFIGMSKQINQLLASIPRVVEAELASRISRQVSVKSAKLANLETLIISDLSIANGKTFEEGTAFTAKRVVISTNFIDFVFSGNFVGNIKSVTLINPRLRVARDKQGVWNFEDLLRLPPVPPEKRFRGKVFIRSGQLSIVDHAARLSKLPATNRLTNISGSLDFAPLKWFSVDLSGQGSVKQLQAIRAIGRWGVNTPTTNLTLNISNANAPYWLDYFSDIRPWNISQGKFSAKVVLFQSKAGKITARGTVNLRNSSITSLYLNAPIRPFTANIKFAGTNLTLIGHGLLNNSPLKIQGKIHGFTPSQLSLHITSDRLDLNTIEKTVRSLPKIPRTQWQSPAKLSATITGTSEQPFVKAAVMVPHAVILNKKVALLSAQGFYREGVISINRLTARTEIGNVRLNSQIFVRSKRITASGEVSSINLAKFPPQFAKQISGFANAKFSVDYLRKLRTAKILANVRDGKIGNLSVSRSQANIVFAGPQLAQAEITIGRSVAPGILIEKGVGSIAWQNRKIIINHAIIDTLKGSVTANGSMTADGILGLDVSANNINMQTLLHPLGYEEFAGTANFKGTLSGMISNPKLSGEIKINNGTIKGTEYDLITSQLIATSKELVLRNAALQAENASITTTGEIIFTPKLPIRAELTLRGRQLPLAKLAALFGKPLQANGIASADLRITGSYPNLMAEGDVTVHDATVSGVDIDEAKFALNTIRRETTITSFYARKGAMLISGSGTIGTSGKVEAAFQGENLELSLLNPTIKPYAVLDGPLSLAGNLSGTVADPTISGMLESTAPVINSQPFEQLSASFSWKKDQILFSKAKLSSQTGTIEVPQATYRRADKSFDILSSAISVNIERILAILQNAPIVSTDQGKELRSLLQSIPKPTSGVVTANAMLTNLLKQPSGNVRIDGSNIIIGGQEVGTIISSARLSQGIWLIDQLQLSSDSHMASIQGSIGPENKINLTGKGEDVPLAILGKLLNQPELAGKLTFELSASGTTDTPIVEMSAEVKNAVIRNLHFDTVTAEHLSIANNRLTSDYVKAIINSNQLIISGSIPFYLRPLGIPRDQPVDIKIEVPTHDLSTLASLIPSIKSANGRLDINLSINGSFEEPQLKGNLAIKDGKVRLDHFENDFTNLKINANFENSVLLIEEFSGASSAGGTFSVGGNIAFPNLSSAIFTNFARLDDLNLLASNIAGAYGERIRLSATGYLTMTNEFPSPLIQGQIIINDALMEAPVEMPPSFLPPAHFAFNPKFEVSLTLADNVQIRRGQLNASIVGPISINGDLNEPEIVGTFAITKGSLDYPGRTFNLEPGGTATLVFRPPESHISVNVVASTRITTVSPVTGRITRYTVNFDISGPAGNLDIDVTSSPPGLTREQALGLVFRPTQIEALLRGEPFGQVLQRQLPQILLGIALPSLFEEFETGPFIIAIEPGFDIPLILNVGTSLTERLSITYSRSLVSNRLFSNLGISYMIYPKTDFTILFEDNNRVTYLLQAARRF